MKLLRGFHQISELGLNTAATIGNFDGVHCGHVALLKRLSTQARALNLPVLVMLFEPQPSEFFRGREAPARLSSFREKLDMLRQVGVDYVCCLKFNKFLAAMPAVEFADHTIFSLLKAKYLLVGEDFRFGNGRQGDIALLKSMGSSVGCVVEAFSDFFMDQQRVSSTRVRKALQDDALDEAATLLGRDYSMCGRVIHGDERGRKWGVPTANLSLHRLSLPIKGVFCVRVLRKGRPPLNGVANIGCRPTVDGTKNILEVHLFDINESLYGEILQVNFLHKIRNEIKFASLDALIAQIHNDVDLAKTWFKRAIVTL